MGRDLRFEIEFLLSLTVGVLAFLAIKDVRDMWNTTIGYLFLLIVAFHMVAFVTYYIYDRVTKLEIPVLPYLEEITQYTLISITGLFFFLVVHIAFAGVYKAISPCNRAIPRLSWWCSPYDLALFSVVPARTFFTFVIPFISVLSLAIPLLMLIPTFRLFQDIDVIISPPEIDIYDNFENTKPFSVTIQNRKDDGKARDLDLSIDAPEKVVLSDETEEMNCFNANIEIGPRQQATLDFKLKYVGEEDRSDSIQVAISHGSVSKKKSVDVVLYAPRMDI